MTEQDQARIAAIEDYLTELTKMYGKPFTPIAPVEPKETEPIKEERWKPALNEKFWYLLRDFSVHYDNLDHTSAHYIANSLNCFPTEVAAQIAADKIKQLLKEL